MKKIITLFIMLSFALTLAACGGTATTVATTGTTESPAAIDTTITGPVTISFWHAFGGAKETILQGLVNDFTALNPNISVELLSQGDYNGLKDKVIQSIVTGDTPTMLIGYPDHVADYLEGNGVISLDPYIDNPTVGFTAAELADFVPAYLQENQQFDGITYGLPFNKSSEVLIYNKNYFESKICKTGFTAVTSLYDTIKDSIPSYDAAYIADHKELEGMDTSCLTAVKTDRTPTWDQVQAASVEIHSNTNKWGFSYDSAANLFITMTHQWGGEYTNAAGDLLFDNAQTYAALTWYQTQHTNGLFTLPAQWEQSYSSTNFINQDVYMTVGSTAGMSYNVPTNGAFDIGCAPIPAKDADHKAVIQQGTNISIMSSADSQQRLAAWLLTKYLTSKDATVSWAMQTGYLPVRLSAYEDPTYLAFLNTPTEAQKYNALAEKTAMQEVDSMFYDPAFRGSSNARTAAETIMGDILFGGVTPENAISDALYNLED